MKENYISFVLEDYISDANFNYDFGSEWIDEEGINLIASATSDRAFAKFGFEAKGKYATKILLIFEKLVKYGGIMKIGDEYTGYWYKLNGKEKSTIIEDIRKQNPVFIQVSALGGEALRRAIARVAVEDGLSVIDRPVSPAVSDLVPASDRIVKFNDNEISQFDDQATKLIEETSKLNEIEGEGIRELILGNLRAGREMIRSGCARAYLLQITFLQTLAWIAKRYEKEAVGALANALLTALVFQFGLDG